MNLDKFVISTANRFLGEKKDDKEISIPTDTKAILDMLSQIDIEKDTDETLIKYLELIKAVSVLEDEMAKEFIKKVILAINDITKDVLSKDGVIKESKIWKEEDKPFDILKPFSKITYKDKDGKIKEGSITRNKTPNLEQIGIISADDKKGIITALFDYGYKNGSHKELIDFLNKWEINLK